MTATPPADHPDPSTLLAVASDLARAAGDRLLAELSSHRADVATKTSHTDMVTEMDRATEAFLVEGILASRPDDGIVGEEGADHPGTSGVRWVLDPIDGTTNYVYGLPGFAVSVAAEVDGAAVVGVVVDPVHGDMFTATRGGGARRNGERIAVSNEDSLDRALVSTGFSYEPERRRRQAHVLTEVLPAIRDIRRPGAAAVDLCWVACGRVDAFYEKGLQRWDYAAGALIASEAGAVVTDLDGGPPSSLFTVAATPGVADALRSLLARAGAGDA